MKYDIALNDITYTVTAYNDDGMIFANIMSADGLHQYAPDQLPGHFDEDTHETLNVMLRRIINGQSS